MHVGKYKDNHEYPVLFHDPIANLYLNNNKARDIEGNIIQDGTVVEFSYINDVSIEPTFRWVPLRTRFDKTDMVKRYKRKYGNFETVANKIWSSIMDSIELTDIELLSNDATYETHMKTLRSKITSTAIGKIRQEDAYYQEKNNLAKPLREFNNYIKSNIIYTYCFPKNNNIKLDVLDIGCGKGGDINKFYHAQVKSCIGIDKDSNGIYAAADGAISRYMKLKSKFPNYPKMSFTVADASRLLNYEDQLKTNTNMVDQNKKMLIETFGETETSKNYKTFDVINCQFAVHYFFENDLTWNNYCQNINKYLKPGGFLLISTLDGNLLNKSFKNSNTITKYYITDEGKKEILYEIKRNYTDTNNIKKTGLAIDILMPWINSNYLTEYIVDPLLLSKDLLEKANMRLLDNDTFGSLYELYKPFFDKASNLESKDETKTWFMKVKQIYNTSNEDTVNLLEYTRLNRFYIYQKLK